MNELKPRDDMERQLLRNSARTKRNAGCLTAFFTVGWALLDFTLLVVVLGALAILVWQFWTT